ncbi:hypothetical protein ABIF65_006850 [Bradyrhizobium japonicum]|nr:hypothetical protein [Bradyrhizobium japonicum]MCP1775984.1 hypothetical protein [Bradyrhizobium japonicum]MCP1862802.1 hypothetical protein [Bradyrhizobium japonicum]MCP1893656.1 hypothetical protein [Bradyrhizobium japonicum]MCP1961017.1 hypothetical protein [Bradyrhizobium japonicum]
MTHSPADTPTTASTAEVAAGVFAVTLPGKGGVESRESAAVSAVISGLALQPGHLATPSEFPGTNFTTCCFLSGPGVLLSSSMSWTAVSRRRNYS